MCCGSAQCCQQESQTRGATLEKIRSAADEPHSGPYTEATYTLQVWPDPPNNEEPAHQGQIFEHIQIEWGAQVVIIKGAAAAEAKKADKCDDVVADKDDSKQAKLKSKQFTHHSKKKKEDSSKRIEPLDDNLDEYFGPSQSQNSQETANLKAKWPKNRIK